MNDNKENNEIDNKSIETISFWKRTNSSLSNVLDSYYYRGLIQGTLLGSLTTFLVLRYRS